MGRIVEGGCSVGNGTSGNASGATYHWVAFNEVAGSLDVGSYTGNGANNRPITGVGLLPEFVLVRSSSTTNARAAAWRTTVLAGNNAMSFTATANDATSIRSLAADGFTLGTGVNTNANTNPYTYLAFRG